MLASRQVAAARPMFVRRDEVPADLLEKEREIYKAQALESGKPEKVVDRIVDGKIDKFFQQVCLEEQEFIKENGTKVLDHVKALAGKLGENIQINRFARFEIGEGQEKNESC